MKVKSDHRSKFSNLSNWKEEARKISDIHAIHSELTHEIHRDGGSIYRAPAGEHFV